MGSSPPGFWLNYYSIEEATAPSQPSIDWGSDQTLIDDVASDFNADRHSPRFPDGFPASVNDIGFEHRPRKRRASTSPEAEPSTGRDTTSYTDSTLSPRFQDGSSAILPGRRLNDSDTVDERPSQKRKPAEQKGVGDLVLSKSNQCLTTKCINCRRRRAKCKYERPQCTACTENRYDCLGYVGEPRNTCYSCYTTGAMCNGNRPNCSRCTKSKRVCPGYPDVTSEGGATGARGDMLDDNCSQPGPPKH